MPLDERTTQRTSLAGERRDAQRRGFLVVMQQGAVQAHALPAKHAVSIGRSATTDVRVDAPTVSRCHAVLHMNDDGPGFEIEDAGSANGTCVRGRRLSPRERVHIAAGEAFEIGGIAMLVTADRARPRANAVAMPAPELVVADAAMRGLVRVIDAIAPSDIHVLITGETGTGKELLAREVHRRSPRASGPMLAVNCAALPESLLEGELFGYRKGAFTGAASEHVGLIESAAGGTLLLDEIGDVSPQVQTRLLRVLDERAVLPVGARRPRPIDVRFIAATHRDLERAVQAGTFRRDLFFRLNGVRLRVPPLRERRGEIGPLAQRFCLAAGAALGRGTPPRITEPALRKLREYDWPGNVRELRNVIERAVALAGAAAIEPADLDLAPFETGDPARPSAANAAVPSAAAPSTTRAPRGGLRDEISVVERERIADALAQCGGNQTRAAKLLGISRTTLSARLDAYGVARPRK